MNINSNGKSRLKTPIPFMAVVALVAILSTAAPRMVCAQIYVGSGNGVGVFSAYGVPINASLIPNLNGPQGIAISGTNLYVANFYSNTIGAYTTSGDVINSNLITGLSEPEGLVVTNDLLFVANYSGAIGEFTTAGTTINTNLIAGGFGSDGLAFNGTNIFVGGMSQVAEYKTNAARQVPLVIIPGFAAGIAVFGTNLFVVDFNQSINQYSVSGAHIHVPLITGLHPNGIAASGGFLFVLNISGTVGLYTTAGVSINPSLFTTTSSVTPFGIAIGQNTELTGPPSLTVSPADTNIVLSWTTNASAFLVETSSQLDSPTWSIVTNTPTVSNACYNIALPTSSSSQFYRLRSIY